MTDTLLIVVLLLFQLKHYLADFQWQADWMVSGKLRYGQRGGVAHAGLHASLSFPILLLGGASAVLAATIAVVEWVLHFHIDWAKAQLDARLGLDPGRRAYWQAFGADQLVHQATYVVFVAILLGVS